MSPERRKRLPKRPKMSVQKKDEEKGRFGSSQVAILATVRRFGCILGQKLGIGMTQSGSVKRKRVGGYCFADCILLQNLTKSASTSAHACQGAADIEDACGESPPPP